MLHLYEEGYASFVRSPRELADLLVGNEEEPKLIAGELFFRPGALGNLQLELSEDS